MTQEHILLILSDQSTAKLMEGSILRPAGYQVTVVDSCAEAEKKASLFNPNLAIIGDNLPDGHYLDLSARLVERHPTLPLILFTSERSDSLPLKVMRLGLVDWLSPPLHPDAVLEAVQRGLNRRDTWQKGLQMEARRVTAPLQERLDVLETLTQVGRSVTAHLDLDNVLTAVVDAAVYLTKAEEGSLLLIDEETGELYMRAARNFQDEFVRTFRLPVSDTIAGQVVQSGEPAVINASSPQKIKTAYLVQDLIYVPLKIKDRVIGVLGVDNRERSANFGEQHLTLMAALADYAAIAIENARLYAHSEVERSKLETILTRVKDGVIILDQDERVILINQTAKGILGLNDHDGDFTGKPIDDLLEHEDLLEVLKSGQTARTEITFEDGCTYNTQISPIPEVGLVATMHDITQLKELDRIKNDFVNAVSHDLRSPLTAILGYIELIERVGPVTDQQREFIQRVQLSVQNITGLINDLLDLGRIEAGFDAQKELVPISVVLRYAVDGIQAQAEIKNLTLESDFDDQLPPVFGNPIRLRQMLDNLLRNAVKYTPEKGLVKVKAHAEEEQVIIQISDNGMGVPPADQAYIFDKFYRASNIKTDMPGTGLGLAIVRSIIDNHRGRIWLDSKTDQGATFTIVLPVAEGDL